MSPLKNKLSAPGEQGTLDDWLHYLEAIHPVGIDLGLERVLIVLRRLLPHPPAGRIVTVAGTNGKGSTIACLEQLLRGRGRRVGSYTSPHLHRYNERVRIDGADVSDGQLIEAFRTVEKARGVISLTYFEFGTLAAFLLLEEAGVDDWLLEIGLGGRLDAVNVLDPDLAIITSVDIDHIGFLGDNREVIGFEKAGILRPGMTAICADPDPPSSVLQQARAQQVQLLRPDGGYSLSIGDSATQLTIGEQPAVFLPDSPLPASSLAAALVAFTVLEPGADLNEASEALGQLRVPGRMECLGQSPAVYVDVGHNPHAARWLCSEIARRVRPEGRVHAVYAALGDKDIEGVTGAMSAVVYRWYLAGLSVDRGLSGEVLQSRMTGLVADDAIHSVSQTVEEAISRALEASSGEDLLIVFGSFYTAAAGRFFFSPGDP